MNMPVPHLARRLQWALLAFFLLAVLFLVGVSIATLSIPMRTLLLLPSLTARAPAVTTLLLVGVGVFLADVMIGVLHRWRSRVLAHAGGLLGHDPRCSRHDFAVDGDPACSVPALVHPVADGCLLDRGRRCRVDAPALSASWSVGHGKTGQSQDRTPAVTR